MANTGEYAVVHCANTPNGLARYDHFDIDLWHWDRGFRRSINARRKPPVPHLLHIGYQKVILIDGTQIAGRRLTEHGAHTPGVNSKSWGVCLIGTNAFTTEQWASLASLIGKWEELGATKVIGHRDRNPRRECPGFDVAKWRSGGMAPLTSHTVKAR